MFKILFAEDDENLRNILVSTLEDAGYSVVAAIDGKQAVDKFCDEKFDLVISDVMMPGVDGNELVKKIRAVAKDIPILMLTALETIADKEKSFDVGADDYITKPFSLKELLLRVKALLRRYGGAYSQKIVLPHTVLDYETCTATVDGASVDLVKKEFLLLFKLLSAPDKIFSREQLMNDIWGYDSNSQDRTVDTHIKQLRSKIESSDFEIVTVRGLGYKAALK